MGLAPIPSVIHTVTQRQSFIWSVSVKTHVIPDQLALQPIFGATR